MTDKYKLELWTPMGPEAARYATRRIRSAVTRSHVSRILQMAPGDRLLLVLPPEEPQTFDSHLENLNRYLRKHTKAQGIRNFEIRYRGCEPGTFWAICPFETYDD
jgi:hypothetical protein